MMLSRCTDKSNKDYNYYGGRGIRVCKRWLIFNNFYDDMHKTHKNGYQIDRINNNRGYSPSNCKWSTRKEQCRNRRNCHYLTNPDTKETKTITEWAIIYGLSRNTITSRIRIGFKTFESLVQPTKGRGFSSYDKSIIK